jgi:hypothetical protein
VCKQHGHDPYQSTWSSLPGRQAERNKADAELSDAAADHGQKECNSPPGVRAGLPIIVPNAGSERPHPRPSQQREWGNRRDDCRSACNPRGDLPCAPFRSRVR